MEIPTIIDIEASGLGRGTFPIEVGFITGSKMIGCTLIKPISKWTTWHKDAEALHGISRDLLEQKGQDITWVANWLNSRLKSGTVYSDGWGNDMSWLGALFDEAEVFQSFRIESLLTLLSEQERELWSDVHDKVVTEAALTRHRASSDAKMIQETYIRIKKMAQ